MQQATKAILVCAVLTKNVSHLPNERLSPFCPYCFVLIFLLFNNRGIVCAVLTKNISHLPKESLSPFIRTIQLPFRSRLFHRSTIIEMEMEH